MTDFINPPPTPNDKPEDGNTKKERVVDMPVILPDKIIVKPPRKKEDSEDS